MWTRVCVCVCSIKSDEISPFVNYFFYVSQRVTNDENVIFNCSQLSAIHVLTRHFSFHRLFHFTYFLTSSSFKLWEKIVQKSTKVKKWRADKEFSSRNSFVLFVSCSVFFMFFFTTPAELVTMPWSGWNEDVIDEAKETKWMQKKYKHGNNSCARC